MFSRNVLFRIISFPNVQLPCRRPTKSANCTLRLGSSVSITGRILRECSLLGQFFCTWLRYNSDHESAPWVLLDNLEFFFCQTRVSGCLSGTTTQKILAVPALQILFGPRPTFGQTGLTGRMFDRILQHA